MTVTRRFTTLTLIGLMAAFIFPVCANAQVGAPVPLPVGDTYDTTPTLTWTCESGPTTFSLVINGDTDNPVSVDAGLNEEGKWDSEARNCDADEMCTHEYTPSADLASGAVTWQVTGQRVAADTSPDDDTDYTTDASEERSFTIYGDVLLSMAADMTTAEPEGTVTLTVSLDNQTNGNIPLNSLLFDVDFTDTAFTPPTEAPAGLGAASDDTVNMTVAAGKLSFEITGEMRDVANAAVLAIPFVVNADATPTDYMFTLVPTEAVSTILYDPTNPDDETNPLSVSGEPTLTVSVQAAVEPGDVGGAEGLDLADAILPMQSDAGMPVTVNVRADVDGDGKIGVVESAYVLKALSTP